MATTATARRGMVTAAGEGVATTTATTRRGVVTAAGEGVAFAGECLYM